MTGRFSIGAQRPTIPSTGLLALALRHGLANALYGQLALFIADNFHHMHVEETAHNAVLWARYTDGELMAIHDALVASIPPAEMMHTARWLVPFMNPVERAGLLGDIINGAPRYVSKPNFSYSDAGYVDFVEANANRKPVIYVAANDGMLHAISADDEDGGTELWAYVPTAVMGNLYRLADSDYANKHRYFVDGAPVVGDIYVNEELFDLGVDAFVRSMALDPEAGPERALRAAKVLAARGARAETRRLVEAIDTTHGDRLEAGERAELLKLTARLAAAEGATDEQARVLEQVVALDPLDGEALILLGQHAASSDQEEQAIFYYERAEGIEAVEADARLRHAQLLVAQSRFQDAVPLLKRAQEIRPREDVGRYLEQVERLARANR